MLIKKENEEKELYNEIIKKINKFEEYEIKNIENKSEEHISEILRVTKKSFSKDSYEFLEKNIDKILLEEGVKTIIVKHKGVLVGYVCYQLKVNHMRLKDTKYYEEELGYISMCVIDPEYHGKGLYSLCTYLMISDLINMDAKNIFVRTQNIKVFVGIKKTLNKLKEYNEIEQYELEFTKEDKKAFEGELSAVSNIDKEMPVEMEGIEVEKGDVGLYLWSIKK